MYETYWHLKEKPFENTPDPRFFYYSANHENALLRLNYGITQQKGGLILTGEHGTGKTLLSMVLQEQKVLDWTKYKIVVLNNPRLTSLEILQEIARQLSNIESLPDNKPELLNIINKALYSNLVDQINSLVIIDDAQTITESATFDEIRLLLNYQLKDRFLLTILLLGQPELRDKVNQVPQLKQRLGIRYRLSALNEDDTHKYIRHRLKIARGEPSEVAVFTEDALKLIYEYSKGLPREINNICDMCLLMGFDRNVTTIDTDIAQEVARELSG